MKVYVIMGNDYPEAVFADETEADSFVAKHMDDPQNRRRHGGPYRIYWRSYEFDLKESGNAE